jgi:RHS repeat-associated protein
MPWLVTFLSILIFAAFCYHIPSTSHLFHGLLSSEDCESYRQWASRATSTPKFLGKFRWLSIFSLMVILLFSANLLAQNSLADVVGIPPDAAMYPIPGVGFVNLNNGNLHIDIPVRTVKDRNGTSITTSLVYDSSDFEQITVPVEGGDGSGCGPGSPPSCGQATYQAWAAGPNPYPGSANEWISDLRLVSSSGYSGNVTHTTTYLQGCTGGNEGSGNGSGEPNCASGQTYGNWTYIEANGTIHPFSTVLATGDSDLSVFGYGSTAQGIAQDGSGYWLEVTNAQNGVVYDSHGNQVYGGLDTNGNHALPGGGDMLGRNYWNYLPSDFVATSKTISVWTDFEGGGDADINASGIVLSSLTLPDKRSYSFQYDDAGSPAQLGHYGSLTGITLPTGGQITITNKVVVGNLGYPNIVVKQITTPDGTWTFNYVPTVLSTYGAVVTPGVITVTAPPDPYSGLASQTTSTPLSNSTVDTVISTYAGAATGTPLRTITSQYGAPGQISDIKTTLENGLSSHVAYTYADECTPRVATKKEYDFSGSLLRETDVSYLTSTSDNANLCLEWDGAPPTWADSYLQNNHHITDIPASVTVYGPGGSSSGSPVAQTNYTYDSTPLSTTSGSGGSSVLGLSVHDDTNFGASMTIRGNPTRISQMVSPGNFITTKALYYNVLGEVVQSVDGNGYATNYDFTDNWSDSSCISSPVFAYPTTTTNAKGQVSKATYNSCDGSIASIKDQNDINAGRSGTVTTYDGLQRVIATSYPDGGQTTILFNDTIPSVTTTTIATPDPSVIKIAILDGLGRTVQTQLTTDPTGTDYVDTKYDDLGRVFSVSNAYRSTGDVTYGLTKFQYDALGRTLVQTQPDNSTLSWSYSGNTVDSYDEMGVHWSRTSDALGHLTKVLELGTTAEPLNLETDYTYNSLDDLLGVNQIGNSGAGEVPRTRSFNYDSLSRLTQAYNPESGWTCYGTTGGVAANGSNCTSDYDANGNLGAKTDARGVAIAYAYDSLNRLTSKTYSDSTSPVTYNYDELTYSWSPGGTANTIGRLSSASAGGANPYSRYAYSYDAMGRPAVKVAEDPDATGIALNTSRGWGGQTYDLAGNVITTGYNYGAYISLTRNGAGQVTNVTSNASVTWPVDGVASNTVLANATYTPIGTLSTRLLGNGLTETKTYDNRERLTATMQSSGSKVIYGSSVGYAANGNVTGSSDTVNGNWTYSYDSLNRILTASVPAGLNLAWSYDSFGNRKTQTASGGSAPQSSLPFTGNTNRVDSGIGISYDAAGHVTLDNLGQSYNYDAEGRVTAAFSGKTLLAVYEYTSDGDLVYEDSGKGIQVFQRDAEGRPVWTYVPPGGWGPVSTTEIYADDWIGAWQDGTVVYAGKDWIGTKRYESFGEGSSISEVTPIPFNSYTSLPFGDNLSSIGQDSTHFTGKERDAESGLDYFGARYYGSSMGRMMSPDPGNIGADPANPQSWNMYSYVNNNPLRFIDPTGKTCQTNSSDGNVYDDGDGQGCATVDQQDADRLKNGQYSATVTANADNGSAQPIVSSLQTIAYTAGWALGVLPSHIYYGQNSLGTQDMRNTGTVKRAIQKYKNAGCPASGDLGSGAGGGDGHFGPWQETRDDILSGTPNPTQAEVGGYTGSITNNGDGSVSMRIDNTTGLASLTGASTYAPSYTGAVDAVGSALGAPPVVQTFQWTEPSPCAHR